MNTNTDKKYFEKNNNFLEENVSSELIADTSCDDCNVNSTFVSSDGELTEDHKKLLEMCKRELKDELPDGFDQWTDKEQFDHLMGHVDQYFPNIPKSLRFVLPAICEEGDCGRAAGQRPSWLDVDKFRRGQQFAMRYFAVVNISSLLSLLQIFSFENGLKPLILSRKSDTPYRVFTRYLSTVRRVRNWYTSDPWSKGTPAYRDIQTVRGLHRAMRRRLCKMSDAEIDRGCETSHCPMMLGTIADDFADSCPAPRSRQCPYTMTRTKGVNQAEMLGTQYTFVCLMVLYPWKFGVRASDDELHDFCHLWRGLGHFLGIRDELNFCRGTLQEIRERCEDFLEHWVKPNYRAVTPEWEHMSTCLFDGGNCIMPTANFKLNLLLLCDMCDLRMTRLYESLGTLEKALFAALKFFLRYLLRLPGAHYVLNAVFHTQLDKASNFGEVEHAKLIRKFSRHFTH